MSFLSTLQEFINFLSFAPLKLNWIDFLVLVVFIFYAVEGYAVGFLRSVLDLVSFISSFLFGLIFYSFFARLITGTSSIPQGVANAMGFFIASFIAEIFITIILRQVISAAYLTKFKAKLSSRVNGLLGVIPGILSAFILLSFILTLIIALPVSPFLKSSVFNSRMGRVFVSNTLGLEKNLNEVFGGAVQDAMTFLTVEPKSNEIVNLRFKTNKFTIDTSAEREMIKMVNSERAKTKLNPVTFDYALTLVARKHCEDMASRGYFSHYTPEGKSPFDRMDEDNVSYTSAGENLALAPNTILAMQGLMNSPGHRANILSGKYGRVGIGVIDVGVYGQLYCQEFTN